MYRWYTPLLHLDTHVKLVQYIKLASAECGYGTELCRPPRLPLVGAEREQVLKLIRAAIATRPARIIRCTARPEEAEINHSFLLRVLCVLRGESCNAFKSSTRTPAGSRRASSSPAGRTSVAARSRSARSGFREQFDTFRSCVVNEPRGSDVLVGALLCEPHDPACVGGRDLLQQRRHHRHVRPRHDRPGGHARRTGPARAGRTPHRHAGRRRHRDAARRSPRHGARTCRATAKPRRRVG